MSFVFKLTDRFLSPLILQKGLEATTRARILVGLLLSLMAYAPIFVIVSIVIAVQTVTIITMAGCCVGVALLVLLKKTGRIELVSHLTAVSLLSIYIAVTAVTGGYESPMLIWLVTLPVLVLPTIGRKPAFLWFLISCLLLVGFFCLKQAEVQFPQLLTDSAMEIGKIVTYLGLVYVIFIFVFITTQAKKELIGFLEESYEHLSIIHQALDGSGDAIIIISAEGKRVFQNKKFEEISGYPTINQVNIEQAIRFFENNELGNEIINTTLSQGTWSGEAEILTKSGIVRPIHAKTDAIYRADGGLLVLIAIFRDISEQKKVEQALKASEEKYRLLAENATDAIWIRDLNFAPIYVSPGIEKIRGFTAEEISRLPPEENFPPNTIKLLKEALDEGLKDYLHHPDREFTFEAELYHKNGSIVWVEVNVKFLKDKEGKPNAIIGVSRDITSRKKTEEELQKARLELIENAHRAGMADVAADTLHNVGNLLNSVATSIHSAEVVLGNSSLSELNKANVLLEESIAQLNIPDSILTKLTDYYGLLQAALMNEQSEISKEIKRIHRKMEMITDVIAAQQRYAGFGSWKESYSLEKLINDVLEIETENLGAQGVRVEKHLQQIPQVVIQKTKLLHILLNLVKNSVDAMENLPNGQKILMINLEQTENEIVIQVADTGKGIAIEKQPKIFSHGFTTKEKGHGFGLHSCAIYMSDMNGKIWFKSGGTDQGTSFFLSFPVHS